MSAANVNLVFRGMVDHRGAKRYAAWFRESAEIQAATSGVYAFRSAASGQWLYIGSATSSIRGNLARTVRRHLQKWESPRCDKGEVHCPGVRLKRQVITCAVVPLDGRLARQVERELQQRYTPRFNDPVTYGATPF